LSPTGAVRRILRPLGAVTDQLAILCYLPLAPALGDDEVDHGESRRPIGTGPQLQVDVRDKG
jgi:hypothetical protein